MKEKILYTCEICNTSYADKAIALKCENTHCACVKIKNTKIRALEKYPDKIEVEFIDGTKRWFHA